jgi:hypothetical protein
MGEGMDEAALQALADRSEIVEVFNRYALGVDGRDAALLRGCFTERVDIQTSGTQMEQEPAEEWVDLALRAVGIFETTQHIITNHRVALEGDEATCIAYLQAYHGSAEGAMTVGGRYTVRLQKTHEGWRIARLELAVTHTLIHPKP